MRSKEARSKFGKADELFREKKYAEALVVLDELDKEFPDTRNVLYPRAMCLAKVGRFDEALDLCRQLKVEFGDARGEKLMTKIGDLRKARAEKEKSKQQAPANSSAPAPPPNIFTLDSGPIPIGNNKNAEFSPVFNPGAPNTDSGGDAIENFDLGDDAPLVDMAALDDLFAPKAAPIAPPIKPVEQSRKGLYIGLGVGALVVAALIAIPFIAGGPPPSPPPAVAPPTAEQAAAPAPVDAPEIEWVTDFETAVSQANEDGTPVLLFLYSGQAASPDVTFMDDYTWSDPAVRNLVKDWICARIDVDTEPELQEQYEITKLPATLVTSYYFDEIDFRQEGTTTSQDFYNAMLAANMIPIEEPEMPGISALTIAMLVLLYVIGTFVPLVITLFLFGRMPDDNLATALVSIFLIGLFAPVLGRILLRETYEFGWFEYGAYYVMFLPTMIGLSVVFTALIGADINILLHLYGWLLTLSN